MLGLPLQAGRVPARQPPLTTPGTRTPRARDRRERQPPGRGRLHAGRRQPSPLLRARGPRLSRIPLDRPGRPDPDDAAPLGAARRASPSCSCSSSCASCCPPRRGRGPSARWWSPSSRCSATSPGRSTATTCSTPHRLGSSSRSPSASGAGSPRGAAPRSGPWWRIGLLAKLTLIGFLPGIALGVLLLVLRADPETRRAAIAGRAPRRPSRRLPSSRTWPELGGLAARRVLRRLSRRERRSRIRPTPTSRGSSSYIWQFYLPRLPFMEPQFDSYQLDRSLVRRLRRTVRRARVRVSGPRSTPRQRSSSRPSRLLAGRELFRQPRARRERVPWSSSPTRP